MILYGARGQAKVIYDLILSNNHLLEYLVDDNPPENFPHNLKVYRPDNDLLQNKKVIIAIGDNSIRELIHHKIKNLCEFETMQHHSAYVSRFTKVGEGTVIMPKVCINAEVEIGIHCIINTGCIIEHECVIEDFVHISPKVAIAGDVKIGNFTHIGIGSSVIQCLEIGKNSIIGAGSVVVKNIADFKKAYGNPCKEVGNIDE